MSERRTNRLVLALLGAAGLATLAMVLASGRSRPGATATGKPDGGATTFVTSAWLDSCMGGCRQMAQRRLQHLYVDKREAYCSVNCECGMEKMTEPGPEPNQLRAPSAAWLRLTEDQQREAAGECHMRAGRVIGEVRDR